VAGPVGGVRWNGASAESELNKPILTKQNAAMPQSYEGDQASNLLGVQANKIAELCTISCISLQGIPNFLIDLKSYPPSDGPS